MAYDDSMVQPKNPTAPAPTPAGESDPAAPGNLPDELIQMPAFQAIFAGSPAAFSASFKDFAKRPEGKVIQKNADALMSAGIGFYKSQGGDLGVLFNQMYVHPDEIKAADKAGTLQEIAPPFDQVTKLIQSSGEQNPVLNHQGTPESFKTSGTMGMPSAANPVPMPSAGEQAKTQAAKQSNTTPGGPLSGAKPGAGRLVNSIMKPIK